MHTRTRLMNIMALVLVGIMVFTSIPVTANAKGVDAEGGIQSLTYEEYLEQKKLETENANVAVIVETESKEDVMRETSELSEGKDTISCENLEDLSSITSIQVIDDDGIAELTIPVVSLNAVALNPESLKNGEITTDTQIAWLWNFSDADGDTVLQRYLGGFPGAYYIGNLNNDLGFVTQFDTPGHYTVLYQVLDTAGEFSQIVGYEFDVVPVEDYQIIEGSFASADEVQTYNVSVDFTNLSTAAFCLTRTGKSNVSMTITDSTGNDLASRTAYATGARKWYFLNKPTSNTTVETYTISVKTTSYDASDSSFRVMIGDKKDVEPMISGLENAAWLDLYTEVAANQYFTSYTPNRDESWYRFTANGTMVFTLLTHYPQIRFQIRDVDDLYVLFDSNDAGNDDIHKTKYCTSYGYAEKARLTTTIGQDYYLVIYSPSVISTQDLIEETMNVTVGKPNMLSGSVTKYASSYITATSSGYSSSASVSIGDNGATIPRTAVAKTAYLKSATSGVLLSMIPYWRVKYPGASTWNNSSNFHSDIEIGYVKDSDTNKNINGTWQLGVQAASANSPLTFVPGLEIIYHYEIGD